MNARVHKVGTARIGERETIRIKPYARIDTQPCGRGHIVFKVLKPLPPKMMLAAVVPAGKPVF
jgi:hypothetical protein